MFNLVTTGSDLISIWNDRIKFYLCKKGAGIFAFAPFDRTTPKMNDEHAGSSVDAVVAALKSPLQKKMLGYFLSSGWARHNYSISFK